MPKQNFRSSRVDLMQIVLSDGYTGRRSMKPAILLARAALLASLLVLVL